jgi:CHAD domain-containing protein
LQDAVEKKRKQIWRRTRQSLNSDDWGKTLHRTRSYLGRHPDEQAPQDGGTVSIDEASKRLARAWARARTRDSDRAWHKLRIAVKDLRYSLDTLAPDLVDYRIELCIALQAQLGTWHDSIVHRELLQELEKSLNSDAGETLGAVQQLQATLVREGSQCLAVARKLLTDSEELLVTDPDNA